MNDDPSVATSIVTGRDIRPVPDPTTLTTEASQRQSSALQNLVFAEVAHLTALIKADFDRVDDRFMNHVAQVDKDRVVVADEFREQLASLRERFVDQLGALAERTNEQKLDTKAALDAALAAQKEAVAAQTASSEKSIAKSETATVERIKATETLLSTTSQATDSKIGDLKERIVAIEARTAGIGEGVTGVRQHAESSRGLLSVVAAAVIAVIAVAGLGIGLTARHTPAVTSTTTGGLPACADVISGQSCSQIKP